ncbi:MAG: hypothetical protein D6675_02150 [Gemmatimonadetes bacterium]|nr:MAG: hypothetical protein D6675_02150 [Gemmatimonadota bacterium]
MFRYLIASMALLFVCCTISQPTLSPPPAPNLFGSCGTRAGQFSEPQGFCLGVFDHIFIADTGNHRVQVFKTTGEFVTEFGHFGSRSEEFNYPTDVATDGLFLYVVDSQNQRVQRFDAKRFTFQDIFLTADRDPSVLEGTPLGNLEHIAVSLSGKVAVTDPDNQRVILLDNTGRINRVIRPGNIGGKPVFGTDNRLYIPVAPSHIFSVNHQGLDPQRLILHPGGKPHPLESPWGIAFNQDQRVIYDRFSLRTEGKTIIEFPFPVTEIQIRNGIAYFLSTEWCGWTQAPLPPEEKTSL